MWLRILLLVALNVILINSQKRNYTPFACPSKCYCYRKIVRCMKLELTEIPKHIPSHINVLDLRFNNIKEIPPGSFKNLQHLTSLLLNNNAITTLRNGAFDGLYNLQNLYLYKNRIKHIEPNVFQNLNRLERIYLQNNEIENFEAGTFSNLPSLERLNLYYNKIQKVPYGAFNNLPKLTRIRLDHNALVCNCDLAWFAEMLNSNSVQGSAICKYPQEMYGKSLKDMSPSDLHCHPPEIMEGPQDLEISLGQAATLSCRTKPQNKVIWMKDHKEVPMDNPKYKLLENGTLVVLNADLTDNGVYECIVKNVQGTAKSRMARMIIKNAESSTFGYGTHRFIESVTQGYGAPRFVVVPNSITTKVGAREAILRCQAVGYPNPVIQWSRNGIRIGQSEKFTILDDGTLIVHPVDINDDGIYQCEASNINGKVIAEANVVINAPPIFTTHPQSINVEIGETIRLECVATSTPPPEITWFKNDREVRSEDRTIINEDGSLLEIRNAQESDDALYVCEARNELGYREVSAKVTVTKNLSQPPKLIYKPYNVEAIIGSTIELPCKATGFPTPGITWQKDGSSMQRTGRFKVSLTGNLYLYKIAPEDQGRYECSAVNEHGRDTASGYVSVKKDPAPEGFRVDDKFVRIAFQEASNEVDHAINRTIEQFIHNKHTKSPYELFKIIRYPDAPARELARAADIYERTLVNIRKHIHKGNMYMNNTKEFTYQEILSPEHFDLVAKLSGCMAHRLINNCSDMCFHSKYRTIDGTCNNLQHPTWGASLTEFRRLLKPIYEDGFTTPVGWNRGKKYFGFPKPPSRKVSTELIATNKITPDTEITHMVMQWGQFLDHDLDHATPSVSSESWDGVDCKKTCDYAAPCYPMDVPPDDPRITSRRCIDFVRSSAICGSGMTSIFFDSVQTREQINQLTSFIDASQVYGYSLELAKDLRDLNDDFGRLREGPTFPGHKPLLPYSSGQMDCRRNLSESTLNCFLAGDIRANEQVGLVAMHTLWMREHNRLARELKRINPQWDSDTLYEEARKIVGAAFQHITYKHWLPYIIGQKGMQMMGEYQGYDPQLNPTISNVFATAALRFGHTLINPVLHRLDNNFQPIRYGHLPLHKAFFSPWRIVEEGGIDPLLRGLFTTPAKVKRPQENLNTELTEQLFRTAHAVALDLAAMNIHRSRDHAIPGYLEFRKVCNMSAVETFDDLKNEISDPVVRQKLKDLYGHPGNIDVWVGGILEDQIEGARIGPLFRCLLIEQFQRLRHGDRFYYENPSVFKPEQLTQIKQYSLARVLCDNGDNITKVTGNVFLLPELQGGYLDCTEIPEVDLRVWYECCPGNCHVSGQFNSRANRFRRDLNLNSERIGSNSEHDVEAFKSKIEELQKEIDSLKSSLKNINESINLLRENTP